MWCWISCSSMLVVKDGENAYRAQHIPPINRAEAALSTFMECSKAIAKYPKQKTIKMSVLISMVLFI